MRKHTRRRPLGQKYVGHVSDRVKQQLFAAQGLSCNRPLILFQAASRYNDTSGDLFWAGCCVGDDCFFHERKLFSLANFAKIPSQSFAKKKSWLLCAQKRHLSGNGENFWVKGPFHPFGTGISRHFGKMKRESERNFVLFMTLQARYKKKILKLYLH